MFADAMVCMNHVTRGLNNVWYSPGNVALCGPSLIKRVQKSTTCIKTEVICILGFSSDLVTVIVYREGMFFVL
jgi:hypothetical protein